MRDQQEVGLSGDNNSLMYRHQTFTSSSGRLPSSSGNLVNKLPESCSFFRLVSLLIAGGNSVIRFPASVSSCARCDSSTVALHGCSLLLGSTQQHLKACYVKDLRRHFLQVELAEVQSTSDACMHSIVRQALSSPHRQMPCCAAVLCPIPAMLILTSMRRSTAARTCSTTLCGLLCLCEGLRSTGARWRLAFASCHAQT